MKGITDDRPLVAWQKRYKCIICTTRYYTNYNRKTCSSPCAREYRNLNQNVRNDLKNKWLKENK